jgi:hypothetical protein
MRSEVIALPSLREEDVASADGLLAWAFAANEVLFAAPAGTLPRGVAAGAQRVDPEDG